MKRTLLEEREYEARLRKYAKKLRQWVSMVPVFLCQLRHEIIIGRIAENNIEILKQDHEKEVETLKEEVKRLKEEIIGLQRQTEEGEQLNSDLQEQIGQLTKHVKTIPELHRDLANLQNQLGDMDRRMKQSSEQARGAGLTFALARRHDAERGIKNSHVHICLQLKSKTLPGNFFTALLKRRFFWGNSQPIYMHSRSFFVLYLKGLCSVG